jgi:hypothetical protein
MAVYAGQSQHEGKETVGIFFRPAGRLTVGTGFGILRGVGSLPNVRMGIASSILERDSHYMGFGMGYSHSLMS